MKQKFKTFLAGFMAMLTIFTTFATSGTTAFAASPQANMKIWFASPRATGEISELKAGYSHGRMFYHWIDGHASYCLNYSLEHLPSIRKERFLPDGMAATSLMN